MTRSSQWRVSNDGSSPVPSDPETARLAPVSERSDVVLARRASLGDRYAFAELFRRHGAGLYRHALRMLDGDHHAAEDAVQEALTKAWLKIDTFHGESQLRTWLFRLLINECLNVRRRRRPLVVDDQMLELLTHDQEADPHVSAVDQHLREALDLALSELPFRQRAAWLLSEIEDLSYAEIAEVLRTNVTVVRGQLHRARSTLAVRMAQWR